MLTVDESTVIIEVAFKDEDGASIIPKTGSVTWSLYNEDDTTVNSRTDIAIAEAATINIVLSGDDLDYASGAKRKLVVKARYDSTVALDLPLKAMVEFSVQNVP